MKRLIGNSVTTVDPMAAQMNSPDPRRVASAARDVSHAGPKRSRNHTSQT